MSNLHRHPPLSWLRAFEAVGRHHSFTQAAEELSVSPQQIERWNPAPAAAL